MTTYLQPMEWYQRGAPADVILTKTGGVAAVPGDARLVDTFISGGGVDREGDVIDPRGWDFSGFMATGGPVLWAHDHKAPPIANAVERPRIVGDRVHARAQFPPVGTSEESDLIHRLIVAGTIRATSVGFKPIKWNYNERRGGIDFHEQELVEFSFVSVPANVEAVVTAVKAAGGSLARWGLDRGADVVRFTLIEDDDEPVLVLREDAGMVTFDQAVLAGAVREVITEATRAGLAARDAERVVIDAADVASAVSEIIRETVGRTMRQLMGRLD